MTTLQKLSLNNNSISDLSPLVSLTGLVYLDLSSNNITAINVLANLSALTDLRLANNAITDIEPLLALSALKLLYIGQNPLDALSNSSGYYQTQMAQTGMTIFPTPKSQQATSSSSG